jgi:glycosyltransferase involved in cell wall biosynthesis
LVTTRFAEKDALQYAGVAPERVFRLPLLASEFEPVARHDRPVTPPYFVWPTNAGSHKNHSNAFSALRIYWEEMEGNLACHVTGVNSSKLLDEDQRFLGLLGTSGAGIDANRARIRLRGELPDSLYQNEVGHALFLWHPTQIDNGTFSVIEAAHLGVPSLSSDYPAMREIDDQFGLNLAWMPSDDPKRMASALKSMEDNIEERRALVTPLRDAPVHRDIGALEQQYWKAIRECL